MTTYAQLHVHVPSSWMKFNLLNCDLPLEGWQRVPTVKQAMANILFWHNLKMGMATQPQST